MYAKGKFRPDHTLDIADRNVSAHREIHVHQGVTPYCVPERNLVKKIEEKDRKKRQHITFFLL
jgi:hypothetical protein